MEKHVHVKKRTAVKFLKTTLAVLLMMAIALASAIIVHRTDMGVPAITQVENGLSAYDLAVQYGYEGTVQDWLQSLTGKSAYDIAKENGYSGTEQEWASSLQAAAEQDIAGIKTAAFSEKGELIITLTDERVINLGKAVGADGKDGEKGEKGDVGATGAQGEKGDTAQPVQQVRTA